MCLSDLSTAKSKLARIDSKAIPNAAFCSTSTDLEIEKVLAKYPVKQKSTRHGILTRLTGELFHKFGWQLSELIVRAHYDRNSANVNTGLGDHIREFNTLWKSILEKTLDSFSVSERAIYAELHTSRQQEAFFIIRSFAHLANGSDFPIAQLSLADRITATQPGAKLIIDKLIALEAIKKMANARPNSRSALYRWIANEATCSLGPRV